MLFIALGQTNGRRNSAPHKCRAIEHRTGAWKGAAEGGEEPRRRLREHTFRRDDDNSACERASEQREIRGRLGGASGASKSRSDHVACVRQERGRAPAHMTRSQVRGLHLPDVLDATGVTRVWCAKAKGC